MINYQKELKAAVPYGNQCIILNDRTGYIFSYLIDKKGHIFKGDYLPVPWIEDMIMKFNIRYMYSDSRTIDDDDDFKPFIDSLILEVGSVRVFKLKPRIKLISKEKK